MLKSKTFIKKTRKGSIVKVVREHYLRDDIGCGSEQCESCQNGKPVLEKNPPSCSNLCKFPHYIMPDTNVVLHQVCVQWEMHSLIFFSSMTFLFVEIDS